MQLLTKGLDLDRKDMRRVLTIMLPALFELVLSQLFTMVDTIMLGRSEISAVAIAAVGLTNNPTNLVRSILIAINVGTTAGVAWAIGAKDKRSASQISRNALMFMSMLGVAAAVFLYS